MIMHRILKQQGQESNTFSHVVIHSEFEVFTAADHSYWVPLIVVELLSGIKNLRALAWRGGLVSEGAGEAQAQTKSLFSQRIKLNELNELKSFQFRINTCQNIFSGLRSLSFADSNPTFKTKIWFWSDNGGKQFNKSQPAVKQEKTVAVTQARTQAPLLKLSPSLRFVVGRWS